MDILTNIAKFIPKKVAVAFGLVAAVLVPVAIYAWGPSRSELDIANPVDYVTFNSYVNNIDLPWYNEFDFVRGSVVGASDANLQNDVTVQAGQTYQVKIFVHNNAATWYNLEAVGVKSQIDILNNGQTESRTTQQVRGWVQADNCGAKVDGTKGSYCEFWDETRFNSADGRKFTLEYVAGSAKYVGNSGSYNLSDSITSTAIPLGARQTDGKIPGCMEYSGWVIVNVRPKFEEAPKTPSYDLEKTVDKTSAKPGDTLNYTLTFKNTGDQDLTNVVIKDQLPTGINWTNVDINVQNGSGITDKDKLFASGVKIASVKIGGVVTIKITTKVANDAVSAEKCGGNSKMFVNHAESSAAEKPDQPNNVDEDNANNNSVSTTVTVEKDCPPTPEKDPNFDLEKKVNKTTAKVGDTLNYTLTFRNTGEIDLTNVVIRDELPQNGVQVTGEIKADVDKGNGITELDNLFTTGVKVARVNVGGSVTITFSAKVLGDKLICGDNHLINKSTSTTTEKAEESDKSNNDITTDVKKDCTPPKKPCPYNPNLEENDKNCKPPKKPCPYNPNLTVDDPNCKQITTPPPVTTTTPPPSVTTTTTPPTKPSTPEYIVATGPTETAMAVLGTGALTFGAVAYLRSRKDVLGKLLRK